MTKQKAVRVDNSDFVRSHGKQPRGFAGWAFQCSDPRVLGIDWDNVFQYYGLFTDASDWARAWAESRGADVVFVLSQAGESMNIISRIVAVWYHVVNIWNLPAEVKSLRATLDRYGNAGDALSARVYRLEEK